jgi:endoglucanase
LAVALALLSPALGAGCFGDPGMGFEVHPVRLNGVGYFPERAKLATVIAPGGSTFYVHRAADDGVVWSSSLSGPIIDNVSGDQVWLADFTEFCDVGEFYLEVPGLGKSGHFAVGGDVYNAPFVTEMQGLTGQRCGSAVDVAVGSQHWTHGSCHTKDAYLTYLDGMDAIRPSMGGWHDAGDYGKYVTNGAFTVGMLLAAWQHFPALASVSLPVPEHGGAVPDFLAEVKWELDWLFTTQGDDGSVSHKVTANDFEGFVMPETDGAKRYYTGVGTSATADLVAAMAAAARLYQPYDADFAAKALASAQLGYAYLQANPKRQFPDLSAFKTGQYGDSDDTDERLWAAAELWETSGDAAVLADLEARLGPATVDDNFDWGNVRNLGIFTYLLSKRDGRNPDQVSRLTDSLLLSANSLASVSAGNAYGRDIGNFWWGQNGAVARTAMNLTVANILSPDPKYLDTITAQVDHLFGRNHYDRSQVTGIGYWPPAHPHHRPSVADTITDPWPGLLVGGQDNSSSYDWKDDQNTANLNEIAINWNGALIYATAAFIKSGP